MVRELDYWRFCVFRRIHDFKSISFNFSNFICVCESFFRSFGLRFSRFTISQRYQIEFEIFSLILNFIYRNKRHGFRSTSWLVSKRTTVKSAFCSRFKQIFFFFKVYSNKMSIYLLKDYSRFVNNENRVKTF